MKTRIKTTGKKAIWALGAACLAAGAAVLGAAVARGIAEKKGGQ